MSAGMDAESQQSQQSAATSAAHTQSSVTDGVSAMAVDSQEAPSTATAATDAASANVSTSTPTPTTTATTTSTTTSSSSSSSSGSRRENLPWVEKYRPSGLDELISHAEIISTITKLIDEDKFPHMLLYGPPGTGKTSTILACARKMYGSNYSNMILELNASDDRGIDVVRDQIKDFASTQKLFVSGFKLIVLDEADAMTNAAQAALRRVVEKYSKNTRFCLICNQLSKIIPAIQSRCTRFRFGPLAPAQMLSRLKFVIDAEHVAITDDGVRAVVRLANGDMRKVLNVLQSASMAFDRVDADAVYSCTGQPLPSDMERIVGWLFNEEFTVAFAQLQAVKIAKGLALSDIVREVHVFLSKMQLPAKHKAALTIKLADIEHHLAVGASERIQTGALVAAFQIARESIPAEAAN